MRALWILTLGAGLLATACSSSASPSTSSGGASNLAAAPRPGLQDVGRSAPSAPQDAAGQAQAKSSDLAVVSTLSDSPVPRLDRMVIATVNLQLAADNAVTAARDAERIASRYGGFVGSSNVKDTEAGREATITLQIPVASASDALNDLRGIGKKVTDESRATQDVTEEYTDVESNIRNLNATEARILSLLDRATKMEEILTLQRELSSIRGQIEKLEGRRRVLENRTSFATLTLRITESAAVKPKIAWSFEDTATQALSVLFGLGQGVATLLIWVLVFSPVWGVPVLIGWLTARRRTGRESMTAPA